jgi:lysophospholipase L1-like esterase
MAEMEGTWTNPEFTGWVSSISLQERTQDDFFNFEFQGFLFINTAGTYAFRTTSDDGSQLFLNSTMIVNNDGLHGNVTVTSADQNLSSGAVPIMVRYFENTGGQTLTVQYRGPDTGNSWVSIPANALKSGNAPTLQVPPVVPTNFTATTTGTQQIDLSWNYAQSKIVILGSSTAFGTGASPIETNSWANRFAAWLNTNTSGANVVNLALGGFDTEDVLPGGDPERNITKALALSPDLIIVNLPSNDVANGIPMEITLQNLMTLRDLAATQGVKMFITTTQPRNFATLQEREILRQTANEIRSTFGNYVIDIYDELTNLTDITIKSAYNADGIHVNNAGHEYIFNAVRRKVSPFLTRFEVQRSLAEAGPFMTIGSTLALEYDDADLIPGQSYFYRLRATQGDTVSQFAPVVNAATPGDSESPTAPGKPVLHRSGYATISITWPVSTDNTGVAGYEIYANGLLLGTSEINAFQATNLQPETNYTFTVIAYDLVGNKSPSSQGLIQLTSSGTSFYSQNGATQLDNLSSWKTLAGIAPSSFSDNGQVFVVQHSLPVGAPWKIEGTISKVVIDNGVTVTLDANPIDGIVDINGSGVLNLATPILPKLGTLSASSKVTYYTTNVQKANYGHLELMTNNSAYTFAEGVTQVQGNIVAATGVTMQGASSNGTTLELKGNLTIPGVPQELANSFGVALHLSGGGNQILTLAADPHLFEIRKSGAGTVTINNTSSAFVIELGSPAGGGLGISDGTSLQIGRNSIAVRGGGNINAAGETGTLGIIGGSIEIESSSSVASHLYLHSVNNSVKRFSYNKSGDCFVHSTMKIIDAVKIHRGHMHSDGNIMLQSTATRTANIEEIENDGQISGPVRVERYIGEIGGNTRFMSASVDGTTIADWQTAFPVTGNFSGASGGSTESSFFTYEHPNWIGYPLATNISPYNTSAAPLEKGKGYLAHIQNFSPVVMINTGELWQGNIAFELSSPVPGVVNSGWNLTGNPYASTIEWNESTSWISADVNSVASVMNTTSAETQFEYFDGKTMTGTATSGDFLNGVVAPGQAFWLQTSGANPSLTITESAKIAEGETVAAGSATYVRLILASGPKKDATVIAITPYGSDAFDAVFDGFKRQNVGIFNFSSITSDGIEVAINNSSDEFCAKQVALSIKDVAVGTYSIRPETLSTLSGIESVKLVDHFTNTTIDFGQTAEYVFQVTADPQSFGNSRFVLVLSRSEIDLTIASQVKTKCNEPVEITLMDTQAGTSYALYSSSGDELASYPVSPGGDITIVMDPEDVNDGINTVVVKASLPGCSSAELPQSLEFQYYLTPAITASDVSVCSGEEATLQIASSSSVASYEWYIDGVKIEGNQTSQLTTIPVAEELYYSVLAVQPNGCKGPEEFIIVSPIQMAEPEISEDGELIFANIPGAQYEWFRNGISVGVTSQPSLEFTGSGAYTVTVTLGECQRTSQEFVVTGISAETISGLKILAYPNPTGQQINLRVNSTLNEKVRVRLTDVTGRTLIHREFSPTELTQPILLNDGQVLQAGVYFIRAEQRSKTVVIKAVIE